MDLSPVIAWSVPSVGVLLAGLFGYSEAKVGTKAIWGGAFLLAIVLGVALTFFQTWLHEYCKGSGMCVNRGC